MAFTHVEDLPRWERRKRRPNDDRNSRTGGEMTVKRRERGEGFEGEPQRQQCARSSDCRPPMFTGPEVLF
jgi:hypothetical protein